MKSMKRIFALALALVMACGLLVVPAAAADEDVTFTVGEWNQTGTTGTVTVTVSGPNGGSATVNMLQLAMQFNKDVLTLTTVETGTLDGMVAVKPNANAIAGSNESGVTKLSVVDMSAENHTLSANAEVVTYTFTVKSGVESCEVDFTLDATQTKAQYGSSVDCTVAVKNSNAAITGVAPTLGTVTLTPATVEVDGTTGGTVDATATSTSEKDITSFVTWSVTPADQGVTVAADGTVTVAPKAKAGAYTVTATPKDGESQGTAKTAELTVTRDTAAAATVEISGASTALIPAEGADANTYTYTAKVYDQYDDEMANPSITWSFTDSTTASGASFAEGTATLTVPSTAEGGEVTITATCGSAAADIKVLVTDIAFKGVDEGITASDGTYGDTLGDLVKLDASKLVAKTSETVPGTFSVKDADTVPNAGDAVEWTVLFNSADEVYQDITVATGTVKVAKKAVTVTADDVDVRVGNELTAEDFTYTVKGLVGEDKLAGTPVYTFYTTDDSGNKTETKIDVTAIDTSTAAEYAIVVSGLAVDPATSAGNYEVKYEDGTLTVRKRSLIISNPTTPTTPTTPDDTDGTTTTSGFEDVAATDWFAGAVDFVVDKGLFKGVSETRFAPNDNLTRAMLATVLYRLAGEPEVDAAADMAGYSDVDVIPDWAEVAMRWAVENGTINGMGDGSLAPLGNITREQLATMLYRYAGSPEVDAAADMAGYADVDAISDWAEVSVRWAVENGIIQGKGNGTLDPQGNATRAEVATMLQRFANLEK